MPNPPSPGPAVTSANIPKYVPPVSSQPQAAAPQPQAATPQPQVAPPVVATEPEEVQLPVYGENIKKMTAKPLADPDFLGVKPKNPMHTLYWANRGHQNGLRVNVRTAQGFRTARKVDVLNCPDFMVDPSGNIVYGDLILMIIGKNAYEGALLDNHNKSIRRVNKFGQLERNYTEGPDGQLIPTDGQPINVVDATLSEVRASPAQRAKIRSFVPGAAEVNAMIDGGSKPQKP